MKREEEEEEAREVDGLRERYEAYLEENGLDEDDLDEETFESEINEGN